MSTDILLVIFIIVIGLLTSFLMAILVSKTRLNRSKLCALSEVKKGVAEQIEKNMEELTPILTKFYDEKSEHYLNNIKKQNLTFCNQILLLILESKPNMINALPGAMATLNEAYANSIYEASLSYDSLVKTPQPQTSSPDKEKEHAEEISQYADLIDQLRHEKKDLRNTLNQALQILDLIYKKYQTELNLPKDVTLNKINYDELVSAFKLSE